MILWVIFITLLVIAMHGRAHKRAFIKSKQKLKFKSRFSWFNKATNSRLTKIFPTLLDSNTIDHWDFDSSIKLSTRIRAGLSAVISGLLLSAVLFTMLAYIGMPTVFDNQVTVEKGIVNVEKDLKVVSIDTGSDVARQGLRGNDRVISIGTEKIRDSAHFNELRAHFAPRGREVAIAYENNGEKRVLYTTLPDSGDAGFEIELVQVNHYNGVMAPAVGLLTTAQLSYFTVSSLWGGGTDFSAGLDLLGSADQLGITYLLFLLGLVSIMFSIVNLIPIPPFDLGRVLFQQSAGKFSMNPDVAARLESSKKKVKRLFGKFRSKLNK